MSTTPNLPAVAQLLRRRLPTGYRAVLFGSRATGTAHARSDWDIGLIGDAPVPPVILSDIREDLEEWPTLHTFDVVDFATVTEHFREVALRKVVALVE